MSGVLEIDAIQALLAEMAAAGVTELELSGPEGSLHLVLDQPAVSDDGAITEERSASALCYAPAAGILLTRHPAAGQPLVAPGATAAAGEVVAVIRTGLLLRPVVAPAAGPVRWLQEAGTLVGYGAPLAEIGPDPSHEGP